MSTDNVIVLDVRPTTDDRRPTTDDRRRSMPPRLLGARRDDAPFGLGALLSTLVDQGTSVLVLCFTRGEASTLRGAEG